MTLLRLHEPYWDAKRARWDIEPVLVNLDRLLWASPSARVPEPVDAGGEEIRLETTLLVFSADTEDADLEVIESLDDILVALDQVP